MGFDVKNSNASEVNWDAYRYKTHEDKIQDVIIVKKSYGNIWKRHKRRQWNLKRLKVDDVESRMGKEDEEAREKEMMEFLNDVEEDGETKAHVNIYRNPNAGDDETASQADAAEELAEDVPEISLNEMLDDLCLSEKSEMQDVDEDGME